MSSNVIPRIKPTQVEKLGKDIATTSIKMLQLLKNTLFPIYIPQGVYAASITIPSSQAFLLLWVHSLV